MCVLDDAPIFHIRKVGVMLLDQKDSDELLDIQEKEFLSTFTRFLQQHFYFSYQYNLTQST